VDDSEIIARIGALADEERRLEEEHVGDGLSDDEKARLATVQVSLDKMWDLLRQRRALRSAGKSPDSATERGTDTVEDYLQ
jgi:Protein of unknown function (DUF2630)